MSTTDDRLARLLAAADAAIAAITQPVQVVTATPPPDGGNRERAYRRHRTVAETIARDIVGHEPAGWCVGMIASAMAGVDIAAEARGRAEVAAKVQALIGDDTISNQAAWTRLLALVADAAPAGQDETGSRSHCRSQTDIGASQVFCDRLPGHNGKHSCGSVVWL